MHWKFDIDERSLVKASDGLSVKSAKLAFPDRYPLRVDFFRGEEPFIFSGKLKATVKGTNRQMKFPLAVNETDVASAPTANLVLSMSTAEMLQFVRDFGDRPAALEIIAIHDTGEEIASWPVSCDISRRYSDKDDEVIEIPDP